jgi:uncharacterized protein (DUF1499 family)
MSSSSFCAPIDLKACPNKPNCVSSKASNEHAIAPFTLVNGATFKMQQLVELVNGIDARVSITHDEQTLHAEFSSRVFGFIDDLDLILDKNNSTLHVRSASRTGYYDFGVNRCRVEKLRTILIKQGIIR